MQEVSKSWKDNQEKLLVDESFLKISLDISDPEALADASSTDNGAIHISDSSQIVSVVDKDNIPYATLEQNMWVLDGNRHIIPETDYGNIGYIGNELSNSDCLFLKHPCINIGFTKVHTNPIPAVTITWGDDYNEYARAFNVYVLKNGKVVNTASVTNNTSVTSIVMVEIVEYDEISIEILEWCLPYHRARIKDVFIGLNKVYGKTDVFSFKHSQSVDPLSTTLPKMNVDFSVSNIDNTYNPSNPDGLSKYLMERQEVKTKYGYKVSDKEIEWIDGGVFYLSEWDAPQNGRTANFVARDLLEFMSGLYYEGVYNPRGTSLYDLATHVLSTSELPLNADGTVKWVIDESLRDIYTVSPLPIDTRANCLQLIANAGCCVIYPDRKGILRIEPIGTAESDYTISEYNSFSKSNLTLSKPLKAVNVTTYQYLQEADVTELYTGTLSISGTTDVMITYSDMATNVEATITGGTLEDVKYYTNACLLKVTANGQVDILVTGNCLSTACVDTVIESGVTGEVITVDNVLITNNNRAAIVGRWVESYLRGRITIDSSWRADPRLDALDIVNNVNEYNTNKVRITNLDYTYNGAFKGSAEGKVI